MAHSAQSPVDSVESVLRKSTWVVAMRSARPVPAPSGNGLLDPRLVQVWMLTPNPRPDHLLPKVCHLQRHQEALARGAFRHNPSLASHPGRSVAAVRVPR